MRDRFARYVDHLATTAHRHGIVDVPFMINVHGTEGGNGVPFAIGVSQLCRTYARAGFVAGSDHYLGELTPSVTADLHFVNASLAAMNTADQPLTSMEFEAGTGDYGGNLDQCYDPATVELKTRLFLAQGNRLINYYLLAGGVNPLLDEAVGDGNDRISFTGERHGVAAPIGPLGERGLSLRRHPGGRACRPIAHARWLADLDEEHDDLTVGFWPDAFMTEYRHPGSATMTDLADDLTRFRGPGEGKTLWRALLFAGFRFGAVDLQNAASALPRTVVLSTGRVLDAGVQGRLAAHVLDGGSLLLAGRLPALDTEGRPCTILADTLGLAESGVRAASARYHPSLVARHIAAPLAETRTSWLADLSAPGSAPVLTDVDDRVCAFAVEVGGGRAIVATTQLPAHPGLAVRLLGWLGTSPGSGLRTDVPGVVVTTGRTPRGERMLHAINPTGFDAVVQVSVDDPPDCSTDRSRCPRGPAGCCRSGSRCRTGASSPPRTPKSATREASRSASVPVSTCVRRSGCGPNERCTPALRTYDGRGRSRS